MTSTTDRESAKAAAREAAAAGRAAISMRRFAPLVAQLALLLLVFRGFRVEDPAFLRLAAVCFAGFVVHYLLPFRFKKQGLILISIVGAVCAMVQVDLRMATFADVPRPLALAALGIGMTLLPFITVGSVVGLALVFYYALRLRLPFSIRLVPVVAIGGVMAWARHNNVGGLPNLFWSIVGSVFMFRLIIYAYDVRASKRPESLTDYLCYILLLPNFYFTLFPVVDYSTFKRSWYARDIHVVAQEGIFWIMRGTIQLMLYRLVYHRLVIGPYDVYDFWTLLQYIFPTYLLYLKVSGHFHIIVGMLKLFGFDLPETHRKYLLASSFTDFWRRINIYWKDFMIKCFFYPVYFRLRRKHELAALIAGTIVVFVATTVLHGYQWFWIRGEFVITGPDIAFWSILAVAVVVNVLVETRRKPGPKAETGVLSLVGRALKVVAMYVTISVLWSMWSTQSLADWIDTVMYWK